MKKKSNIFKCRIEYNEDGTIKITSFLNQQIPYHLLLALNNSVHEVEDTINRKTDWKEQFIRFKHDGVIYEQITRPTDAKLCCDGCVFLNEQGNGCTHPHYLNGTKGNCHNKIYVIKNE